MAINFTVTTTLPTTGCTQQNVYDTIETINPTALLVEPTGLQILSNKIALSNATGYWRKVTKTFTDLSFAGTTNDIEVLSLPAGGVIHAIKLKHSAAFTGGAISAYTLSIGINAALTKYMAAGSAFSAPSATAFRLSWAPVFGNQLNVFGNADNVISGLTISAAYSQAEVQALRNAVEVLADDARALRAALLTIAADAAGGENHTSAVSIRLAAVSTGANLNAATAGSVDVWFNYSVVI